MSRLSHLPTWLFLVGYPLFWIEITSRRSAHTTPFAWLIFCGIALWLAWKSKDRMRAAVRHFSRPDARWLAMGILSAFILFLSLAEACLPPHLGQEYDALNYHYALPHQHLILGTFAHLPWSVADLWPMPIQDALAPYWFATTLPNKFPQFICLIGLIAVGAGLAKRFSSTTRSPWLVAAAIIGSHGFSIQFGSAMLDITIAYLFIAAIDSFLAKQWFLGSVELSFWCWSKSFIPIQAMILVAGIIVVAAFSHQMNAIVKAIPRRLWVYVALSFVLVGGPFVGKSLYYTGTPLAPFAMFHWGGSLSHEPVVRGALLESSSALMTVRNEYGAGRSAGAFIEHFWTIAVPNEGVNNKFDYPLGLPYLLVAAPFLWLLFKRPSGTLVMLSWIAVILWGTWWIGSQQTRWLYAPVVLMFACVFSETEFAESRLIHVGLIISLALTLLSITRAYKLDLTHLPHVMLRPADQALYNLTRDKPVTESIGYAHKEIAYAQCPVTVYGADTMWVLPVPNP